MNEERELCPSDNLVWAILCTVLCCLPLGIVAIVKATKVNTLWAQGYKAEARRASEDAKKYAIWGMVISLVVNVISMLLYVVVYGAMLASFL